MKCKTAHMMAMEKENKHMQNRSKIILPTMAECFLQILWLHVQGTHTSLVFCDGNLTLILSMPNTVRFIQFHYKNLVKEAAWRGRWAEVRGKLYQWFMALHGFSPDSHVRIRRIPEEGLVT